MAILPAVYVTVEDQSYALPTIEVGRVAFIVILSDRGIHNKVVQVNSPQELALNYGLPNLERTGHAHYLAEKFLQYSARLYVVRPVILDDPVNSNNASISNVGIKYNSILGSTQLFSSSVYKFLFRSGTGQANRVLVNSVTYEAMDVGDYIFRTADDSTSATKIVDKYLDSTSNDYILKLETDYPGTFNEAGHTNINFNPSYRVTFTPGSHDVLAENLLTYNFIDVGDKIGSEYESLLLVVDKTRTITQFGTEYKFVLESPFVGLPGQETFTTTDFIKVTYWDTDVYKYYPGVRELAYDNYIFTHGSNLVLATSLVAFQKVKLKNWIFPGGDHANNDPSLMRQVISKYIDEDKYYIVLDSEYTGISTTSPTGQHIKVYTTFEVISTSNLRQTNQVSTTDSDTLWTFYATGAGTYYNNLYLVGVRNIQYESLFTDTDGNPLYLYAFMDLYLYEKDEYTGTSTLIEGPWTVSLVRTIANGQVVRDINTGYELYIENIINVNSRYIRCVSALGVDQLMWHEDSHIYRLQVMSMFSEEQVYKENTLGENGLRFEKGEDGVQYDAYGRLNLYNEKVQAIVASTYAAILPSDDQTIENLTNVIYPWFKFDYILCGGYTAPIQNAARELADRRNDCLCLADTGYQVRADDELVARRRTYSWNTWNAMLYTTFREIFDIHTGKYIWITPVYHAVERHLYCDAKYWISEPVAGIEKGAISEPIKLAYNTSLVKLEDMISVELNPTIVEPDGVYILTQFTTWKRLSILKRAHAVKFTHYVQKAMPPLLKDILQRKMTSYWVNLAAQRVKGFMEPFVYDTSASERYASVSWFTVDVIPDEARNELRIILIMRPLRVIESIHVNIIIR